jgi:hypothetical protein
MRLGVLFNHDTLHQIAHCAPIAVELLRSYPDIEISVLTSSAAQEALVRDIVTRAGVPMPEFVRLGVPQGIELADRILGKLAPLRRVAVLRSNLETFRSLDALMAPEATCTLLKTKFGLSGLKLIHSRHGAGDRSIGFKPVSRSFDLVLVAGEKIKQRLLAESLVREDNCKVVGYAKFDLVGVDAGPGPRFFGNDNPTILYNPHLDPTLSSWFDWGEAVLDLFIRRPDLNLICAPHVMLFQRRLHTSLEKFRVRWRRRLKEKYLKHANIHVDLGSTNCIDMTYTRASDIYMGDVSSQIYEFIVEPRPCLFLNPRRLAWEGDRNFSHWRFGEVIGHLPALEAAIERGQTAFPAFEPVQKDALATTFDMGDTPASVRAARAVADFLNSLPQAGP